MLLKQDEYVFDHLIAVHQQLLEYGAITAQPIFEVFSRRVRLCRTLQKKQHPNREVIRLQPLSGTQSGHQMGTQKDTTPGFSLPSW